jgi:D-amino-acid dehydrogenase
VKIIVIGAGLIGTSSAYYLARAGHQVTVLERGLEPASETSFANGGLLTPSLSDPWNAPGAVTKMLKWIGREDSPLLLRLKALPSLAFWGLGFLANSSPARFERNMAANSILSFYNLDVLDSLLEEEALDFDYQTTGTIKVTRDPASLEHSRRLADAMAPLGVTVEALDADAVVKHEPALAPLQSSLAGGLYFPQDRSGDAAKFTRSLATAAEARGVRFEYAVSVEDFIREGGAVKAVRSSAGTHEADAFVLAAGSYAPKLGRKLGVSIPVRPAKGYSCTISMEGWNARPRLPILDDDMHAVATPLGDRIRLAGTAEFAGYDRQITMSRIENLLQFFRSSFPDLADRLNGAEINAWTGLRPMSSDGVAHIGQSRLENIFINTGHGHLGWTQAVASGRLLADIVSGNTPEIDPTPFSPGR